ncbi:hypothetical protein D3C80_1180040 [compost metagenome]
MNSVKPNEKQKEQGKNTCRFPSHIFMIIGLEFRKHYKGDSHSQHRQTDRNEQFIFIERKDFFVKRLNHHFDQHRKRSQRQQNNSDHFFQVSFDLFGQPEKQQNSGNHHVDIRIISAKGGQQIRQPEQGKSQKNAFEFQSVLAFEKHFIQVVNSYSDDIVQNGFPNRGFIQNKTDRSEIANPDQNQLNNLMSDQRFFFPMVSSHNSKNKQGEKGQ